LLVLQHFLQPLARLSKTAVKHMEHCISHGCSQGHCEYISGRFLHIIKLIKAQYDDLRKKAVSAGVNVEKDTLSEKQKVAVCIKFHKLLVQNLDDRLSDDVSSLCEVRIYNNDKSCELIIIIMYYSKHF